MLARHVKTAHVYTYFIIIDIRAPMWRQVGSRLGRISKIPTKKKEQFVIDIELLNSPGKNHNKPMRFCYCYALRAQ